MKNPQIIACDEATSNLDSFTEFDILNSLKEVSQNKTCLFIAHRLSTVMDVDQILVMDKGKVVEIGTHEELLNKKGLYYQLFNIQKHEEEGELMP